MREVVQYPEGSYYREPWQSETWLHRKWWYWQYSSDILAPMRLILDYVQSGQGGTRQCLYPAVVDRVARLTGMRAKLDERGRVQWKLPERWRQNLESAGLNPDSLRIVDMKRWRAAWQQLLETRNYYPWKQPEYLARGLSEKCPPSRPLPLRCPARYKVRWRDKHKFPSEESRREGRGAPINITPIYPRIERNIAPRQFSHTGSSPF